MKKTLLVSQNVSGEIRLDYYLLTEELYDSKGNLICELYGARIEKHRQNRVEIRDMARLTALGSEILRLVEELSSHTVMPETMEDCVMELLY